MPKTSFEFEHPYSNYVPSDGSDPKVCTEEIEVVLAYEPGESRYGADADGNRGISVPGYFYPQDDAPDICRVCGHYYNQEELEEINKKMEQAANDYDDTPDPDFDEGPDNANDEAY